MPATLPEPDDDAQDASRALCREIAARIETSGGWISFAEYMKMALYLPGLGYYAGGLRKFGEGGDFTTAPELTPLFGQALASQVAQVTAASAPVVLEAGAGSGRLAADLLNALDRLGATPDRYLIMELSGELRARQRETIEREASALSGRVEWLDRLPESFSGCVIANEMLDAMPVHAVAWRKEGLMERGVALGEEGRFAWSERPAPAFLSAAATELPVAAPFEGEIGLAALVWVAEWGRRLEKGALLLIDYGLPRHELWHPQRNRGTLRCHYRHRSHDDPFWWPGLSDITVHVDFTAVAEAGFEAGLDVLGYASQSAFLMDCGIGELLAARRETHPKAAGAANVLLAPGEMGELFKAIALGRGIEAPLLGFAHGDRLHAL
ncbi:MAG: SAM-dependent methyltransferase [Candidatus Nitricoxidivorans perseverans]|uniref:SAM-dependent methyltransferase n=1 Tax=Candidatus Nitricoxidivorans perseverans TaxID=2975601 RepID=A0AA49J0K1_9PROT|nr:MAG: SAM-dependent methyltransferase [Candidatus Nitricoxidivorans perseverans]